MVGDILTAVIEIPKESNAKIEIVKEKEKHPMIQDLQTLYFKDPTKTKIALRQYGIPVARFNYGSIPQTWEQEIRFTNGLTVTFI